MLSWKICCGLMVVKSERRGIEWPGRNGKSHNKKREEKREMKR